MKMHLSSLIAIAGLSLWAVTGASPAAAAAGGYGTNLVVNGNAETGTGSPSNSVITAPKSWTTSGQTTSVQYGAMGGFPDAKSPGPATRGKNLFEGGNVANSTATQTISLAKYAHDIDAGQTAFAFSAWIGGFATQGDNATVSVTFIGADKSHLSSATLGPVTAADRKNITGLVKQSQSGIVPKGARTAVVTMTFARTEGLYNDGSVDDISLILTKTP